MLLVSRSGFGQDQFPPPNLDFKVHNINLVHVTVTNYGVSDPHYIPGVSGQIVLNYPPGSRNELLALAGPWVGAIVDGDTLVSTGAAYESFVTGSRGAMFEFWPRFNPADTIYTRSSFDSQVLGLRPNMVPIFDERALLHDDYIPLAEQEYISQYFDYYITQRTPNSPSIMEDHNPLNARIIQRTYGWSFYLYEKIIFYDYFVINDGDKVWEDVHFGHYSDPHIGQDKFRNTIFVDDYTFYEPDIGLLGQGDGDGGPDGTMEEPAFLGWIILETPKPIDDPTVTWSFRRWGTQQFARDEGERFRWISDGTIMPDQPPELAASTAAIIGRGPFGSVAPGDTLKFTVAVVVGDSRQDLRAQAEAAINLREASYVVPSPPPPPRFVLTPGDKMVHIDWTWRDEYTGINPEEFLDFSRNDGNQKDFDGYAVYRSTVGPEGPWTRIASFDLINGAGHDVGLQYEFTDTGLINGMRYWYAVTSFDMPERVSANVVIPSLETPQRLSVQVVIPGPTAESEADEVYVVPNPYRADVDYSRNPRWEYPTQPGRTEWYDVDRRIAFMNLPEQATITIYTLTGERVQTIEHRGNGSKAGVAFWNLLNVNNHTVGSGLYYFTVESEGRPPQIGKFVIVK